MSVTRASFVEQVRARVAEDVLLYRMRLTDEALAEEFHGGQVLRQILAEIG